MRKVGSDLIYYATRGRPKITIFVLLFAFVSMLEIFESIFSMQPCLVSYFSRCFTRHWRLNFLVKMKKKCT